MIRALAFVSVMYMTAMWTLGPVDRRFVWSPTNVAVGIDACASAVHNAKSPEQTCLLRAMRAGGASSEAMAFTRWFYATTPDGESGFIDRLFKPRFGVVSIARMEFPGRANNNWGYVFVNGKPPLTDAAAVFARKQSPWANTAAFVAIEHAHPNAWVFPEQEYVGESALPGGGQRFTIAAPIVEGCHACARVGVLYLAYDFDPRGTAKPVRVVAVRAAREFTDAARRP